jgi:hypothetical protein
MTTLTIGNAKITFETDAILPGINVYKAKLITGNWPSALALGNAIDERYTYLGGRVTFKGEEALIGIYND